jgi:hypothetical protein
MQSQARGLGNELRVLACRGRTSASSRPYLSVRPPNGFAWHASYLDCELKDVMLPRPAMTNPSPPFAVEEKGTVDHWLRLRCEP